MNSSSLRPWLISSFGLILTIMTARHEALLVATAFRNPEIGFRNFMANSIFEGRSFGGSDFGVTLAIIAFLLWIFARHKKKTSLLFQQSQLKFIWLSALLTAICAVHSLKWIISRARPKLVITEELNNHIIDAMTWPGFMPIDGPRGIDWNSFPSGHTASCAIMLAYTYLAWPRSKLTAVTIFLGVTLYSGLMGVARSMAGMHWFSDSVASFFLAWLIIDLVATKLQITRRDS